jgi:hypothetical protein
MKAKGYESIEDFRGKLKPYVKPTRVVKDKSKGESATEKQAGLKKNGMSTFQMVKFFLIFNVVLIATILVVGKLSGFLHLEL